VAWLASVDFKYTNENKFFADRSRKAFRSAHYQLPRRTEQVDRLSGYWHSVVFSDSYCWANTFFNWTTTGLLFIVITVLVSVVVFPISLFLVKDQGVGRMLLLLGFIFIGLILYSRLLADWLPLGDSFAPAAAPLVAVGFVFLMLMAQDSQQGKALWFIFASIPIFAVYYYCEIHNSDNVVARVLAGYRVQVIYFVIVIQWLSFALCFLLSVGDVDIDDLIATAVIFVLGSAASVLGPYIIRGSDWTWLLIYFTLSLSLPFWLSHDGEDNLGTKISVALLIVVATTAGGVAGIVGGPEAGARCRNWNLCWAIVYGGVRGRRTTKLWQYIFITLDAHVYRALSILIIAVRRRFPLRAGMFIGFYVDAFLLKRSMKDVEFVHRLLRDYFALRQLMPRLAEKGFARIQAVRALGYQGEAALEILAEFVEQDDPEIRAAAISSLGRIPSPISTLMAERCLEDTNPQVRKGLIELICKLPNPDEERLFERLVPIGHQGEIDAIVEHYSSNNIQPYVVAFVDRMGVSAVKQLLNVLTERRRGAAAAARLLSWMQTFPLDADVLDQLRAALNDRNAQVVVGVIETLVNQGDVASVAQFKRLARSRFAAIRAAAQKGILKLPT
jgi:hypothetical protein